MKKYIHITIYISFTFSMTGIELAEAIKNRSKPIDIQSESSMLLINKKGKKKNLKLISKSKDDSKKQMIWFLEPKDDYGISFLKIEKEEAITTLGEIGLELMLKNIRDDLADISVEFDNWFNESELFTSGQYQLVLDLLKDKGYSAEREGALWFTSTVLGEDKDNVLIRSNGLPTYFASDVAYHYGKFNARNFDKVIDVWGADHQGHVPRMKAVMNALDIDPDRLTILISQLVTLKRGEETVRASKRTGELVTLRELITEVGPDACRYFFLSRAADSQMEFDMELALKQSSETPVFYIQYAHA